ncbi:MAG TPA: Fic family protein [Bacteroidales bacterium]|nr:Fic family protein [Bacteroidales bacterium]
MENNIFSQEISIFHGRNAPETGSIAGYGAVINKMQLPLPMPYQLALISKKHRQYTTGEWIVLTPRHKPQETLYSQLVFALKYEGVNLLFFKKLFENLPHSEVEEWIINEPLSQYSRKLWFLFEWLMNRKLDIPDLKEGNYVLLLDNQLQFTSAKSINSSRHRVRNNLPGTAWFCPLIKRTPALENFIDRDLSKESKIVINGIHRDILLRTSAFLLLKDSKASFFIEGETPTINRAVRWGKAIGQAGSTPLSKQELLRLQQIVIDNNRFVKFGFRTEGGFVGEHDRTTGEPIPEHISARHQDIDQLIDGLLETSEFLEKNHFHSILSATVIAFGFVFIHPFSDGNGRIHRYIIHHILTKMNFTPQGIIFPVSAAILERINEYRLVLEKYSHPLLPFIDWKKTPDNNVEVLNDTIDYYRYFDATPQAKFLFECVDYTINTIIPGEVEYFEKFDLMKTWLDDTYQMPDKMISTLVRFLSQNNGILSKRAKEKEFSNLLEQDVRIIEEKFGEIFLNS